MDPLEWTALEHAGKKKEADWYWALGIIALSGAGASVIFGNILFAVLILIGGFTLALQTSKPPEEITFTLGSQGLTIGSTLYPYNTLESFWIVYDSDPARSKLLITSKKILVPHLVIPFGSVSPETVHAYLAEFLKEVEQEESFLQKIVEFLGF